MSFQRQITFDWLLNILCKLWNILTKCHTKVFDNTDRSKIFKMKKQFESNGLVYIFKHTWHTSSRFSCPLTAVGYFQWKQKKITKILEADKNQNSPAKRGRCLRVSSHKLSKSQQTFKHFSAFVPQSLNPHIRKSYDIGTFNFSIFKCP